ncbi:CLUMA_CG021227, isoform A [Clunio marinus]|uniref:CLUMA_CG021227, isoform A n=1 Tax=Clunio marinus TaxID=568069 RepID=A0A1J1J9L2_9DIPT|nr:CLUMA_CG021227, isoform A [Clunio marinus]
MLLKKNFSVSQVKAAEDGSWKCPNISDNRSLECGCDVPLTLRCSGDVHSLSLIAEGLRRSTSFVSILDCTLKNVTVLNEAKIFEGVSLSGLFISSGEIKRVHRLAFSGLKTPLQILGLPNNALNSVPSNSFQQLTSLDRLDLSNNEIKILSPTDFVSVPKLSYLEISENQISSISQKTFLPLKNLVTLKLNGNKLGNSPGSLKTIAECINLRELDLQSNLIKGPLTSETLPTIKDLEILNLERNSFSSVGAETFKNFPKLTMLSLRHNQIDVLADDAFIGLNSLQKLDLSYNGIVAVSGGSLKHMNRLKMLDFTHNFLRAITTDIINPLPQLSELKLDGNDISIVERNALNSAKNLKNISLRDNPLACDCKLQYFAEWLTSASQFDSKNLMAFCKTPPFLEGAQLSQLSIDSLTCAETHLESENDQIMFQVNSMFSDFNDNFTMINSSSSIMFVDYNFTVNNDLNLNWILHLNKSILFHSLVIFEGSDVRMRMDKSTLNYRSFEKGIEPNDEYFVVSIPSNVPLNLGNNYEFCLIFTEDDNHFYLGCSTTFLLIPNRITTVDLNSRILKSTIQDSDISDFDSIADKQNNPLYMNDDMQGTFTTQKNRKNNEDIFEHDDSIEVYPSREYYNTLWPNVSLSILIICMSISIIYILFTKYRYYYKHHQTESISPSYSEDSINTQIEDENDNTTNKYIKLQATTAL